MSCDQTSPTAAAFAGYRFNSRLMLELDYRDLGEARATYPRLGGRQHAAQEPDLRRIGCRAVQ